MTEQDGPQYGRPADAGEHRRATDSGGYGRPPGVDGPFAPQPQPEPYTPPPPTVSPAERATFSRPAGGGPSRRCQVSASIRSTAARSRRRRCSPLRTGRASRRGTGSRRRRAPASPPAAGRPSRRGGRHDAARDPWRDPASPFWLGRGAIFTAGSRPSSTRAGRRAGRHRPALDVRTEDGSSRRRNGSPQSRDGPRARLGLTALLLSVLVALVAGTLGGCARLLAGRTRYSLCTAPTSRSPQTGDAGRTGRRLGRRHRQAGRAGRRLASRSPARPTSTRSAPGVVIDKARLRPHQQPRRRRGRGQRHDRRHVLRRGHRQGPDRRAATRSATSPCSRCPNDQLTVATLGNSSTARGRRPGDRDRLAARAAGHRHRGHRLGANRPVHVFGDNGQLRRLPRRDPDRRARSTRATPAVRWSTPAARSSASTPRRARSTRRQRRHDRRPAASATRSRSTTRATSRSS